jgi:threonylcarbamoyladenosine tRNA methylthiotransferase MtaB
MNPVPQPWDDRPTFSIATLGCKVNQYESQAIRERLLAAGYSEVPFGHSCDASIVNTCVVTEEACRKSRKHIRKAARSAPGGALVVTGCLAEMEPEEARATAGVTHVISKAQAGHIAAILRGESPPEGSVFDLSISAFASHTRAFLKVQDGCDSFCSYCIVPHVRGPARSRNPQQIRCEAERLVAAGFREIVLCGIHLGLYGKDMDGCARLEDIIEAVLEVEGLARLRLSSIEVNEVSERLIERMASEPRLCPHLHIPLQSGDEGILKAMNRRYTAWEYLAALDRVRARVDTPSITTDVLVGFPGESDEAFERTLSVCRQAGFSRMHIFPFCPRPGTPAANFPGRVSQEIRREREARALDSARQLAADYKRYFVAREVRPLVERERDKPSGKLCGYTERYLHVLFDGPDTLAGRIARVHVSASDARALYGVWSNLQET